MEKVLNGVVTEVYLPEEKLPSGKIKNPLYNKTIGFEITAGGKVYKIVLEQNQHNAKCKKGDDVNIYLTEENGVRDIQIIRRKDDGRK